MYDEDALMKDPYVPPSKGDKRQTPILPPEITETTLSNLINE